MTNGVKASDNAFLSRRKQLVGDGEYTLVNPNSLYRGKSYSDWATDWFNWYLSADADNHNSGPVVFLRSQGIPKSKTGVSGQVDVSDTSSDSHFTDFDYPAKYVNDPNIRVGKDRLQVFDDQAVFIPIIVAYQLGGSVAQYRDWGNMQDFTGLLIDNGDNPPAPYQLTIDNIPMHLEDGEEKTVFEMIDFRIVTPIFTAVVPDAPYGTSIKDFVEEGSIPPGTHPVIVDGYFVMLKFTPGSYWVHSWASTGREPRGPYFSELLYQIDVGSRPEHVPHGSITAIRPARNQALFARLQRKKTEFGELVPEDASKMTQYFGSIQELKYMATLNSTKQTALSLKDNTKLELADKISKSAEELKNVIASKNAGNIKAKIAELNNSLG